MLPASLDAPEGSGPGLDTLGLKGVLIVGVVSTKACTSPLRATWHVDVRFDPVSLIATDKIFQSPCHQSKFKALG